MRVLPLSLVLLGLACPAAAHHPNRQSRPVTPRIDVIPPLGNNLPPSYRRRYNRPRYLGGKIAYWIAPSSQEAMAWHRAVHHDAYRDHRGRIEYHYFYRRPWEALRARRHSGEETDQMPETAAADDPQTAPEAGEFTPTSRPVVVRPWHENAPQAAR